MFRFTHINLGIMPQRAVLRIVPLNGIGHRISIFVIGYAVRQEDISAVKIYSAYLKRLRRRIFFGHLIPDAILTECIVHFRKSI